MSNIPISQLPAATEAQSSDVLAGVQSGATKKFSLAVILNWIKNTLTPANIGAYEKPSGGIPKTDLASGVQTSLGLADTAYQLPSNGIPASDLASGVIPTVPSISTSTPNMDSTAAAGSTGQVSDAGHTHPSDTSKANETELAYMESGSTASRPYAAGDYFCWGGALYLAKTAISSGAALTVGTNCEQVSGGGLNAVKSALDGKQPIRDGTSQIVANDLNAIETGFKNASNYSFVSLVASSSQGLSVFGMKFLNTLNFKGFYSGIRSGSAFCGIAIRSADANGGDGEWQFIEFLT